MQTQVDLVEFVCPAGHRFRAKKAAWVNCIGKHCIEDARPIGSVRQPRIKQTPLWAGFDLAGDPVPANPAAQAIVDGEESARRRATPGRS